MSSVNMLLNACKANVAHKTNAVIVRVKRSRTNYRRCIMTGRNKSLNVYEYGEIRLTIMFFIYFPRPDLWTNDNVILLYFFFFVRRPKSENSNFIFAHTLAGHYVSAII